MILTADHLARLADAYAAHRGLSLTHVSALALAEGGRLGGTHLFVRIKAGGGCTMRNGERAWRWFGRHWPADLEWPADVPRPPTDMKGAA